MITLFLDGLLHGVWVLGAALPTLLVVGAALVTAYRLTREEYLDAHTFMEDFPPEIPTSEPEPEPERHRFIASTIVRPPNISERKDDDDTSEE